MSRFFSNMIVLALLLGLPCHELANSANTDEQCNKTAKTEKTEETLLGLPAGDGTSATETHKLVLGESTSLYDKMGPLVINDDGSTRRIANWDVLTEKEKQNTLRVISRRNKVRLYGQMQSYYLLFV